MIFIKNRLQIIFILLVCLCLSFTFGVRVNASETQILKAEEIEKKRNGSFSEGIAVAKGFT